MDDVNGSSRYRMSAAAADRRASYKTPGGRDGRMSQEARRQQALDEQKRRRLQRVDESRNLDLFADLNLGDSDEDDEDDVADDAVVREGISQFASMLQSAAVSTSAEQKPKSKTKTKRRKKRKSKWADKCMYAELLEMNEDVLLEPLFEHSGVVDNGGFASTVPQLQPDETDVRTKHIGGARYDDGIPEDLETAWAALSPVPAGKRCLAVTTKGAGWRGAGGGAPNTFLRARLTGLPLRPPLGPQQPFPTALPPNTILDCILDKNWKSNGVLHVLDVVRWKGVDLGGCGAGLRFWWRDTRLGELVQPAPPSQSACTFRHTSPQLSQPSPTQYTFSYPNTFAPVPYMTPTPYETLIRDVIPNVRRPNSVRVRIPTIAGIGVPSPIIEENQAGLSLPPTIIEAPEAADMQIDTPTALIRPQFPPSPSLLCDVDASIAPDGILLYLTEASYTSGTGPLSAWVPLKAYGDPGGGGEDADDEAMQISPVDLFERLLQRRLRLRQVDGDLSSPEQSAPRAADNALDMEC